MIEVSVDIREVAKRMSGLKEVELMDDEPIELTSDQFLYRFNDDHVHIVVDAVGGYSVYLEPEHKLGKMVPNYQGHLSEFLESVH